MGANVCDVAENGKSMGLGMVQCDDLLAGEEEIAMGENGRLVGMGLVQCRQFKYVCDVGENGRLEGSHELVTNKILKVTNA
ncbi:hypothetical protein L6452_37889 [Arctium lappa]|uniref:Uncharacterized protein n=1 Tax=Arctium lappa TaxID=4217 RepID=A0ACB8Y4R7_ARCLA|nr:hypothetical protein L6452_37889 [Arctium lappa]